MIDLRVYDYANVSERKGASNYLSRVCTQRLKYKNKIASIRQSITKTARPCNHIYHVVVRMALTRYCMVEV